MESKDGQETWAQTNSLLLLGIGDLLEEKGLPDKDGSYMVTANKSESS